MMNKFSQTRLFLFLLLTILHIGCTPLTALRQHPGFDESRMAIERVVILPPTVSVERIMFSGDNEILEKESYSSSLVSKARRILNNRGYPVSHADLMKCVQADPDLAFQVEQIKDAYEAASKELYDESVNEDNYKRFESTLGPIVNPIADIAEADAIFLMKYEGITKSDGQMKKEIAANVLLGALTGAYSHPVQSASGIEVALIDGITGDILWINSEVRVGLGTGVLSDALNQIPEGNMHQLIAEEKAAAEEESRARAGIDENMTDSEILQRPASWQ